MTRVSFGIRVPNSGPLTSVSNIADAAQAAESMGFDSVFLHDHVVWSTEMHRHHISSGADHALTDDQTADFYEALTTVGYLSALTSRVQLGIACMVTPMRNPIYAAKQLATLDHLSDGRLIVGVGLGSKATHSSKEFEVFGVPFAQRAPITDEYVAAMLEIWTSDLATYQGKHVSFSDMEMFPKPVQRPNPPVWVGGWTDFAARRTGRLGDGWVPGWLSPQEMARGAGIVRETAQENGRDPDAITIAVEKLTSIAPTRDEAMEHALPTVQTSSKTYERDVDEVQFALDRHIFGSTDDVKRRVEEFVQAGVTHFELKFIYPTMDALYEQMQLWADEILPLYRD